jgi:enoyl-CoA hydratase/carnithine racemase
VATIRQNIVCFEDGPTAKMEMLSTSKISITLPEYGTLEANYRDDKLVWTDGDEWVWAGLLRDDSRCSVESSQHTNQAAQNPPKPDSYSRSMRARIGGGGGAASDSTSLLPNRKVRGLPDPTVFPGGAGGNFFWSSDGVGPEIEYPHTTSGALWCTLAQSWVSYWGAKRNIPVDGHEEPRVRLILTDSYPRVFMIELNSPRTTNMLDGEMTADHAMAFEAISNIMQRHNGRDMYGPMSYVFQGTGPHFCPGGNPNTYPNGMPDGVNQWTLSTYSMAINAMNWNKLGIPGITCLHGSSVGGGAAQTLNTTFRAMEHRASVSFGNLSRGMVPIMLLAAHIPRISYAGAISYYLTDDTWGPTLLYKCGYCRQVVKGQQESKNEGLRFAKRLASSARASIISSMRAPLDMYDLFTREAVGLDRAGRLSNTATNQGDNSEGSAKTKAPPKIEADPDIKVKKSEQKDEDSAVLKLEVPNGKTVLEMKQKISIAWSLSLDDFTLMNGDKELKDTDIVPEKAKNGSIKLVMKEDDQWSTEYGEDYDYDDYDWGEEDYDYDEE